MQCIERGFLQLQNLQILSESVSFFFFFDAKAFFFSSSLLVCHCVMVITYLFFFCQLSIQARNQVNHRAKRVEQRDIVGFDEILSSQEL